MDLNTISDLAVEIALEAGEILKKGYGTLFKISSKEGKHNLVTEYDFISEKMIIKRILDKYPDHFILSEEKGKTGKKHIFKWVVDPLDGTVNFAHNIPFFAVSIGIMKDDEVFFGVVYSPMTNELFTARKGQGAFLNKKKIHVSSTSLLDKAILATGFPYNIKEDPFYCIERFSKILHLGVPIRRMGVASLDLCYVASGRFDGFWEVGLMPWDCAAGNIIIEEAGGKVTDWKMGKYDILQDMPILASNKHIHKQIYEALA